MSQNINTREKPDDRRERIENEQLHEAISKSIAEKERYDLLKNFGNFDQLLECVKHETFNNIWTKIVDDNQLAFLQIKLSPIPEVISSLVINNKLELSIYHKNIKLKKLNGHNLPQIVNNINVIYDLLDKLLSFSPSLSLNYTNDMIESICNMLEIISPNLNEAQRKSTDFISEQLRLINCKKVCLRYSPYILIFFSILESISPHAYKFLRNSHHLIIPHPRTLQKLCASYNINPQSEQSDTNFLSYIKQKSKTLNLKDKTIILMIDEIYVKPYLDFKGGNILGIAYNNEHIATTAYVFMIRSLLSPFKDVVHILPVKTIKAKG